MTAGELQVIAFGYGDLKLPAPFAELFMRDGRTHDLVDGQYAERQGYTARHFSGVLEGRLRARTMQPTGEEFLWGHIHPGQCFGAHSLIDVGTRIHDVIAEGPCRIVRVERAAFLDVIRQNPQAWLDLTAVLLRWMRNMMQRVEDIALLPIDIRVARILVYEAHAGTVLLSQGDIGAMCRTSRKSVNVVLGGLEADCLIKRRYGSIDILDRARLMQFAVLEGNDNKRGGL